LCALLTHDLLAIAKFLVIDVTVLFPGNIALKDGLFALAVKRMTFVY